MGSQQDVPSSLRFVRNRSGLGAWQRTMDQLQGYSNSRSSRNTTPNPFRNIMALRHCLTEGLAYHHMTGITRLPSAARTSIGQQGRLLTCASSRACASWLSQTFHTSIADEPTSGAYPTRKKQRGKRSCGGRPDLVAPFHSQCSTTL